MTLDIMLSKRRFYRPRHPFRRHFLFAALSLLLIWAGLWITANKLLNYRIKAWITAERAAGHTVSFDETRQSFSPFTVTRHLRNVAWNGTNGNFLKAEDIALQAHLWCWRSITATFERAFGTITLLPTIAPLTLNVSQGSIGFAWNGRGSLTNFYDELSELKIIQNGSPLATAETVSLKAKWPDTFPKDHTQVGLTVISKVNQLAFYPGTSLPFGNTLSEADVALRIMGTPPDFANKNSLTAWNAASGVIEIDSLHLDWAPLNLVAQGTLAFNNALQPEGAFSGTLGKRIAVVQALADHGWLSQQDIAMLNESLDLVPQPDSSHEKVSLSIQEGGLLIGAVRLTTIPPIPWPSNP